MCAPVLVHHLTVVGGLEDQTLVPPPPPGPMAREMKTPPVQVGLFDEPPRDLQPAASGAPLFEQCPPPSSPHWNRTVVFATVTQS
eukprot:1850963-Pyramimonas_sp.AAC.1